MERVEDLIVTDRGVFLGRRSQRLQVRRGPDVLQQIPFFKLRRLVIVGRAISLSSDVIEKCVEHGVQIDFLQWNGQPIAKIVSPQLTGTVATRRAQLKAYDSPTAVAFAGVVVRGKVRNQANTLRYFAKARRKTDPRLYDTLYARSEEMIALLDALPTNDAGHIDEVRPALLNIEGRAGALYWAAVQELLPDGMFQGREHRGATDMVNSVLNYGYGILYTQVWGALTIAGLDPFAGFLHVDRPGKPSLVLDLMEEYRSPVVDRPMFGMLTRGTTVHMHGGLISPEDRGKVARRVLDRLDDVDYYQGKQHKFRTIIQQQARRLASFLRGEGKYDAHIARW